jgi:8-amino-7-oxononanoate synthase
LRALERDLAQWEGTEAAVVFSTGYMANLAVVSSLAGRDDVVFSDAWNHASLIDGCRLARARVCIYPHADLDCLRDLLKTQPSATSRRLIVTDSVFSMDGDLAPLADLLDLAEKFDALVILDEAHATGVLGKQGRGVSGMLNPGIHSLERLVKVGTLSKALGAQGGFVCGSRALVDYLVNHARPYIFSTALAPPTAAAARKAIALCQSEPWRQEHVQMLASQLRRQLRELGRNIGATQCQIIPILVGQPEETVQLAQRLRAQGLLVPGIRPPSVPAGTARLRISLTAGHTEEDIRVLLGTLAG